MNNWLISPTVQIVDINGNPVVGGKVFVYDADTSNLSTIYSDETTPIANPVEIDELGNVTIWAELSKFYDVAVYDASDNLLFAKKHICPGILSETNLDINAGDGCIVTKSGDTYTISVDFDTVATQAELVTKQDKLEAGRNIEITPSNVINVTGRRAIVTQSPLQSNMSDSAWVVSFDSDTFIDSNGIMETSKLEYDPTSSRYVSYNGIPLGETGSTGTFTGVSANIPFTGNGTNESPLGLLPYISYGGNGITSTYSKSGLRVLDSNNNSAYYSSIGTDISTTTSTVGLNYSGATFVAYPSVNISAPWTSIITKANEPQYIPTVSSYTFIVNSEVDVQYSAVDKVNEISFIAARWGNFENYSANFKDGDTNKGTLVIPSGKVMTATKSWDWEENGYRWCKKLQDGTLMPM